MKRRARTLAWRKGAQASRRTLQYRVAAAFLRLLRGLPGEVILAAMECGQGSPGVYSWCHETGLRGMISPDEVAWPAEYVLRLHRKHILCWRKLPPLSQVGLALENWRQKIRWRERLGGLSGGAWASIITKKKQVTPCPHLATPSLERDMQSVIDAAFERCRRSRSQALRDTSQHSNVSALVRWSLKLLRQSGFTALPTDKDAGYAVLPNKELANMKLRLLESSCYEEFRVFSGVCFECLF